MCGKAPLPIVFVHHTVLNTVNKQGPTLVHHSHLSILQASLDPRHQPLPGQPQHRHGEESWTMKKKGGGWGSQHVPQQLRSSSLTNILVRHNTNTHTHTTTHILSTLWLTLFARRHGEAAEDKGQHRSHHPPASHSCMKRSQM